MWERIEDVLAVLGVLGLIVAGFTIYDRYRQNAKPNIQRFEAEQGLEPQEWTDGLLSFLLENDGKRIYL
jgi:hypothetical protein